MDLNRPLRDTLPIPEPINSIAEDRSTALGNEISGPLAANPDLETTLARFGEEITRPYANA
jgi:hypothetical protein